MSQELENILNSFVDNKVPAYWAKFAFLSLKPLASWFEDLVLRVKFMEGWVAKYPQSYWAPAFFFPQGFFTSVKQKFARKTMTPIDTVEFNTNFHPFFADDVKYEPEHGVMIHGLFFEGCRFDMKTMLLQESEKGVLFDQAPCIEIQPVTIDVYDPKGYPCPLYKTTDRYGQLSTTGESTNFVMFYDTPTKTDPVHWIRRGVALVCLLNE